MSSTKIQWRVQVRRSRAHKWVNKGLFETRSAARKRAASMRSDIFAVGWKTIGFGNTRVVRYQKGAK